MGYKVWNGPMATTAAQLAVTTGTSIKTMLQIAPPATKQIQVVSWGWSIDTVQGAAGTIELISTDVAATVVAHVASGVQPLDPNAPASLVTLGTTATGYTASGEGSITATRTHSAYRFNGGGSAAANLMAWDYQFMQVESPIIKVSTFLRVRATMGTTTGMLCWIVYNEVS